MGPSIRTVCAYPVFFLFRPFPFIRFFFLAALFNLSKHETIWHQSKNQTTIFPAEVILNRRIIERKSSVPTNYTIIYKYVRDRLGGQIRYIEFDVANCVSNRLAFDCRHVTCRIKSTCEHERGVRCTCLCDSIQYVWWKLIFTGEHGKCSAESHRCCATWRSGCNCKIAHC